MNQSVSHRMAERKEDIATLQEWLNSIELAGRMASQRVSAELLNHYCSSLRKILDCRYLLAKVANESNHDPLFITLGFDAGTVLGQWAHSPELIRAMVEDISSPPLRATFQPAALGGRSDSTLSFLVVPVDCNGTAYGWFCLIEKLGADQFSDQDELIATTLGSQLAFACNNAVQLER